ncbi:heterokaryon incompatibility protein-domain-containing protein [Annulohypoxylon bovei var. microspora]|nr:heterokaryon incompatibility protein-domain-containing protein [Annulohypoxylon bovei var. microspora]
MTFYRPLRSNNGGAQIRLCSLLPASFESPLSCHIEPFDISPTLEFEALSYTWGNPKDLIPIEVNGEMISVTKNLATALTYLRKGSSERYLWIDAICINQNDLNERSAQVAMMGKIYQTATRVISWLGTRDLLFDPFVEMEHATLLFDHIKFLKKYPPFQEYLEGNGSQTPYSKFEKHKSIFNDGLYSLQLLIGEREREKPAYWQRAWIIQEVASAGRLILQSGPYTISEEDIGLVTEFISSPKVAGLMDGRYEQRKSRSHFRSDLFVPISIYRSLLYPNQEDKEKRVARIRGPMKILSLLRHNRSRFCADKRDKVYAILGLSDLGSSTHPGIIVDYNKPIPEVYIGIVQAIIDSTFDLEVLCSTNLAESAALPGLPSWVPNWGAQKSPDTCERPLSYHYQEATGTIPADYKFWTDGKARILSATGFCFGSVLDLKDPFVKLDVDMATDDAMSRLLDYASLYRQLSQAYKDMAMLLLPKSLSADLFRQTCSLGLLRCDLDDSFQSLMDLLELSTSPDHIYKPIDFSGNRFRLKMMASSINSQCMFAIRQTPLRDSTHFADGAIGIAPPGVVRKGDLICLLFGCNAPLILRPVGKRYVVVCAAYVHNLMDGSAMAYLEEGLFERTRFDLE